MKITPNWFQSFLGRPGGSLRSSWGHHGVLLVSLEAVLGSSCLGISWGALAALWGALGSSWDSLGPSWFGIGMVLDPLGRSLEAPGSPGASQIDQKVDPKIDPKSSRIRDSQNGSNITPAHVSELGNAHRNSIRGTQKNYQYRY